MKSKDDSNGKYPYLLEHDITNTKWAESSPQKPFYLFPPSDTELLREYETGWRITEVMPVNVLGFQTHRDDFAVGFDSETLYQRLLEMRDTTLSDEQFGRKYRLKDNKEWHINPARMQLRKNDNWKETIIQCLYRPFDWRFCCFSEAIMDRPRRELKQHVAGKKNLCLNTVRQTKAQWWQHALVSDSPTPAVFVELKDGSSVFPLYLYPDTEKNGELFANGTARHVNLNPEFIADMEKRRRCL
jgi:hypothetical protein